jgi:hypothetical protein
VPLPQKKEKRGERKRTSKPVAGVASRDWSYSTGSLLAQAPQLEDVRRVPARARTSTSLRGSRQADSVDRVDLATNELFFLFQWLVARRRRHAVVNWLFDRCLDWHALDSLPADRDSWEPYGRRMALHSTHFISHHSYNQTKSWACSISN